jgi:hypothetical protein
MTRRPPPLFACDNSPPTGAGDEALVYAKGRNEQRYRKLIKYYRARGVTDSELINAMVCARGLVSTVRLGGRP